MNVFVTANGKQLLRATFVRNQFVKRFRVSSVELRPRGVLIADLKRSENRKRDNKDDKDDTFQYKRKANNTQNIDAIDPVVLKYTKFLSDLKVPNVEQRYVTRFGAIRFDDENIPKVHGQYEESSRSLEEAEQFGEELFEVPQLVEGDEQTDRLNYVDEYYFGEAVERSGMDNKVVGFMNTENIGITQSGGDMRESNPSNEKGGSKNLIDEVYFGNSLESSVSSSKSDLEAQNTEIFTKVKGMETSELSYPSMKPSKCTSKENLSISDWSQEVSDMNFIDNHYFSESLINRGSDVKFDKHDSEKHTGTFESKIQKDFLNEIIETDLDGSEYSLGMSVKDKSDQKMSKRTSSANEVFNFVEVSNKNDLDRSQQQRTSDAKAEKFGNVRKQSLLLNEDIILESNDTLVPKFDKSVDIENPKSAYDYVRKLRKEHYLKEENEEKVKDDINDRGYKRLKKLQFQMKRFSRTEMVIYLKKSILYDNYGIIGLYKPFGLPVQEGSGQHEFTLTGLLPDLAKLLKVEKIHHVHRLDIGTTGVILLARTEEMANTLRKMLHDHKVVKTYWAITKGIPHPSQGLIDIPMEEGMVDGRRRMILRPNIEGLRTGSNRKSAQLALTKYKVLSPGTSCALVEVQPVTGIKHQIRAHLGFGLSCPVIGDHKYSHLKKLAPQRLPGDLLECLKIPQSRVRDLPIFLHARSVLLPEVVEGRNILIKAAAPAMFSKALSVLKISKRKETE